MQSVVTHIIRLIKRHDCVIVPGWGALLSARVSAHFDEQTGRWTPPSRRLAYNPSLRHNDGILASSIVRVQKCTYEAANRIIDEVVAQWTRDLAADGNVYISHIGKFVTNSHDSSPTFEPDTDYSASNASFIGLPTFTVDTDSSSIDKPLQHTSRFIPRKFTYHLLRAAASVAIIVAITATLLSTIGTTHSNLYTASLFHSSSIDIEHESTINTDPTAIYGDELKELRIASPGKDAEPLIVDTLTHRYFLIVASLATATEAANFIEMQPSSVKHQLNVLQGNSRYRVYVGSAPTFAEANNFRYRNDYFTRYPDAWVYEKP